MTDAVQRLVDPLTETDIATARIAPYQTPGLSVKIPDHPPLPDEVSFPTSHTQRCCLREVGKCAGAGDQGQVKVMEVVS